MTITHKEMLDGDLGLHNNLCGSGKPYMSLHLFVCCCFGGACFWLLFRQVGHNCIIDFKKKRHVC